ncbi:MAG: hypothetical protein UZ03_NOB001000299 [Nitrospira sp. OLB3]|nr:MAG: hypothetical protein UZ03_NOB001000299 [Nitrospira sp. OLB3]
MYSARFNKRTWTWEIRLTDQHGMACRYLIPLEAAPWGNHEPTMDEALTYIERVAWQDVSGMPNVMSVSPGKVLLGDCDVCGKEEMDCRCERCPYCDRAFSDHPWESSTTRCVKCDLCKSCCSERSCTPFDLWK